MSQIVYTRQDDVLGGEDGNSLGDEDSFLRGITVSFSWDYPDDYSLKDVQDHCFFSYNESNSPRLFFLLCVFYQLLTCFFGYEKLFTFQFY